MKQIEEGNKPISSCLCLECFLEWRFLPRVTRSSCMVLGCRLSSSSDLPSSPPILEAVQTGHSALTKVQKNKSRRRALKKETFNIPPTEFYWHWFGRTGACCLFVLLQSAKIQASLQLYTVCVRQYVLVQGIRGAGAKRVARIRKDIFGWTLKRPSVTNPDNEGNVADSEKH
eukprot:g63740.t1